MTRPRAGFLLKAGGSVIVAGVAATLFLLSRPYDTGPDAGGGGGAATPDRAVVREGPPGVELVDRQIDTVLARFGISHAAVKKRSYAIPDEKFTRTERIVPLPDSIATVSVNAALNEMAKRYGGRAVAAENARLGTVTIHIELEGMVVHTVILRKSREKAPPGGRQARPAT